MSTMNAATNLGWGLLSIGLAAVFIVVACTTDHDEFTRRARQVRDLLLTFLHPWAGRGRSPSGAHPAVKAATVRGWSRLSEDEAWEFGVIADMIKAGMEAPEPQYPAAGREQ